MTQPKITWTAKRDTKAEALVVFEGADLPAIIAKEVRRQWKRRSVAVVATLGHMTHALLVAHRKVRDESSLEWMKSGARLGRALTGEEVESAVIDGDCGVPAEALSALLLGLHRGCYRFERYKSKPTPGPRRLSVFADGARRKAGKKALPISEGIALARDLINTPAEDMGPAEFEAAARKTARAAGLKIRVINAARCRQMGLRALAMVGRASTRPPRLIVLEHKGAPHSKHFLAFAGKGIVFDTGGLDLKSAAGMLLMKKDMGGAATVLGAALALGKLAPKRNLRFYLAIAENSVSGNSMRPGDIVKAFDGTTIEILNTDAEGRLVLADAVALAAHEGASKIIDAATLTGAAMIAMGRVRVPLVGNDETWLSEIEAAAEASGERVWRFPTDPEYHDQIRSKVADLKNIGKGSEAGVLAGGLFIGHFAGKVPWAHLDISPASWKEADDGECARGATGVMVPTLVRLGS